MLSHTHLPGYVNNDVLYFRQIRLLIEAGQLERRGMHYGHCCALFSLSHIRERDKGEFDGASGIQEYIWANNKTTLMSQKLDVDKINQHALIWDTI